jgi:hypothetical protein
MILNKGENAKVRPLIALVWLWTRTGLPINCDSLRALRAEVAAAG